MPEFSCNNFRQPISITIKMITHKRQFNFFSIAKQWQNYILSEQKKIDTSKRKVKELNPAAQMYIMLFGCGSYYTTLYKTITNAKNKGN